MNEAADVQTGGISPFRDTRNFDKETIIMTSDMTTLTERPFETKR